MRTTIRLEADLLRRAKARAAATGHSLNEFISDAIRVALAPSRPARRAVDLPTFSGEGLLPGVDLDDSASLLELMEREPAYRKDAKNHPSLGRVADRKRQAKPRP